MCGVVSAGVFFEANCSGNGIIPTALIRVRFPVINLLPLRSCLA